jgi:uncharacterized membrane protein
LTNLAPDVSLVQNTGGQAVMTVESTGFITIIGIDVAILLVLLLVVKELVTAKSEGTPSRAVSYLNVYIALMTAVFIVTTAITLITILN